MPKLNLNRENFEHQLHRELEEGNISWHDYERLKEFSSNNAISNTTTSLATGSLASGLTVYYCRWYRKRPWSWTTTIMVAPITFFAGVISLQAFRVFRFHRGLQDSKGVSKVLERIVQSQQRQKETPDAFENGEDRENEIPAPRNRWAELRSAPTPASESTWDRIRQSYERSGSTSGPHPDSNLPQPEVGSETAGTYGRQTEQTKFDAS